MPELIEEGASSDDASRAVARAGPEWRTRAGGPAPARRSWLAELTEHNYRYYVLDAP